MTKTKRCPKGHRRNPDTKECDKKAVSVKKESLPLTIPSIEFRNNSNLVPADYDYANDSVLKDTVETPIMKSHTRKRCPKGHVRNSDTKECDKKSVPMKKVSLPLASTPNIVPNNQKHVIDSVFKNYLEIKKKQMQIKSQTKKRCPKGHVRNPITQNCDKTKTHMSATKLESKQMTPSLQSEMSMPELEEITIMMPLSSQNRPTPKFLPTSPDYPPPDYKHSSPKFLPTTPDYPPPIYTKGANYYKTQMKKKHPK